MTSKRTVEMGRAHLGLAVAALLPLSAAASSAVPAPAAERLPASTRLVAALGEATAAVSPAMVARHSALVAVTTRDKQVRPASGRDRRAVIRQTQAERVAEISANTTYDVPRAAVAAYRHAAATLTTADPACHLSWGVVAAIGKVESDHGRFGGAAVLADGLTSPRIVGMALNGHGVARIPDSDRGQLDGDRVWDRAVGPMQFIPTTWAALGRDGDGDGQRNPSDFDDAALSTASYLCSGGADMAQLASARAAVLRYNHSEEYVDLVLTVANAYDSGVVDVVANDPRPAAQTTRARSSNERSPKERSARPEAAGERRSAKRVEPAKPTEQRRRSHDAPSPRPHRPTTPQPAPKPVAEPAPSPAPKPVAKPAPKPVTKTTTPAPPPSLRLVDGRYYLGEARLDFGSADFAATYGDYDRDGRPEPLRDELAALLGTPVKVTTTSGRVTSVNGVAFDPAAPVASETKPSPSAAPTTASLAAAPTTPAASSTSR